jgi:uncharacterized small protein (DUF1192 family)
VFRRGEANGFLRFHLNRPTIVQGFRERACDISLGSGRKEHTMSLNDDDRPVHPAPPPVGADLSALSIEELSELVTILKAEIERVEALRAAKTASRAAADSIFGPPR